MIMLTNALIWIANGFLVIVFFLADHLATLLLLPPAAVFVYITTPAQRPWALGASGLALAASTTTARPHTGTSYAPSRCTA
jgi:hypothetical protein